MIGTAVNYVADAASRAKASMQLMEVQTASYTVKTYYRQK